MGEILEELKERRKRLIEKKQMIQNFDMIKLNAQIQKITDVITLITNSGIDP